MITTRTMGRASAIRITYVRQTRRISRFTIAATVVACVAVVLLFSFLGAAHQEVREQFMEKLKVEKQIVELNKGLKMELAAITQKGYLEFATRERLGLKRPTDEEVVVLR